MHISMSRKHVCPCMMACACMCLSSLENRQDGPGHQFSSTQPKAVDTDDADQEGFRPGSLCRCEGGDSHPLWGETWHKEAVLGGCRNPPPPTPASFPAAHKPLVEALTQACSQHSPQQSKGPGAKQPRFYHEGKGQQGWDMSSRCLGLWCVQGGSLTIAVLLRGAVYRLPAPKAHGQVRPGHPCLVPAVVVPERHRPSQLRGQLHSCISCMAQCRAWSHLEERRRQPNN